MICKVIVMIVIILNYCKCEIRRDFNMWTNSVRLAV